MMTISGSYIADISGAAFFADSSTCGGKSDWFLGSFGELMLAYSNLQGVGGFQVSAYWSSSETTASRSLALDFRSGGVQGNAKEDVGYVRPLRAF
jgi:hypothetical protein